MDFRRVQVQHARLQGVWVHCMDWTRRRHRTSRQCVFLGKNFHELTHGAGELPALRSPTGQLHTGDSAPGQICWHVAGICRCDLLVDVV